MGAVCLPKYLSPHQPSCLCGLFVLFIPKNTHLHIHSPAATCMLSAVRAAHLGMGVLIHKCNPTLACTVQAHKHCYTLGCAHTHIDVPIPCVRMPGSTSTQNLCTHRKPTGTNLHLSVCPSTCLCTHTGRYAHMSTQVLTSMLGRIRDSGGPLASSKDDKIPSSLWSCPKI